MQPSTQTVDHRLIEMSPLPLPAFVLADLIALNIASAVLALLAA